MKKILLILILLTTITLLSYGQSGYTLLSGYPTGGNSTTHGPWGQQTTPYYWKSNGYYGSDAPGAPGFTCSCTGQETWKWTWNGPGAPPLNVIIQVQSTANSTCSSGSFTCDDGYQDTISAAPYHTSTGTHYIIYNNPGTSFYLQLTPTSSSPGSGCGVATLMTPTPVTLNVSGGINPNGANPTIDGGKDECLVGQYINATITAGKYLQQSGPLISAVWAVSLSGGGTSIPLVQSVNWGGTAPSVPNYTQPTSHTWNALPGGFTTPGLSASWFSTTGGGETIIASAMAKDPNGNAIGMVTAQYNIDSKQVYGTMLLTSGPANYTLTGLYTGSSNGAVGMTMTYGIDTPSDFAVAEGRGYQMMGQLTNFWEIEAPFTISSGGWALDNTFQYSICEPISKLTSGAVNPSVDVDSPSLPYPYAVPAYVAVQDYFKSFTVFYPPDNKVGGEYVPVNGEQWSWIVPQTAFYPPTGPAPAPGDDGSIADPVSAMQWTQLFKNPNPLGGK